MSLLTKALPRPTPNSCKLPLRCKLSIREYKARPARDPARRSIQGATTAWLLPMLRQVRPPRVSLLAFCSSRDSRGMAGPRFLVLTKPFFGGGYPRRRTISGWWPSWRTTAGGRRRCATAGRTSRWCPPSLAHGAPKAKLHFQVWEKASWTNPFRASPGPQQTRDKRAGHQPCHIPLLPHVRLRRASACA